MTQFQLSTKLSKYLSKVESQTGRRIQFQFAADLGLSGMSAAFRRHPSLIVILLAERPDLGNPELEDSIAHEATHGYLLYKLRYSYVTHKRNAKENEIKHVNLLLTMIDDIVVNRIIHEEGFPLFPPIYLCMIEKETKAARKAIDSFYDMFSDDPLFKDRFMVFRYILAWAFTEYFALEPYARRMINKYLKAFQRSFPRQFTMANQIREVILQHDIFNADGHRGIVEAVLKLWHLDDLVELRST